MEKVLHIKNMVCDRCILVVNQIFETLEIPVISLELGVAVIALKNASSLDSIDRALEEKGFVRVLKEQAQLTNAIKGVLIATMDGENGIPNENISSFLVEKLGKDYGQLSKCFSRVEKMTIEKYWIQLRVEKAKEYIQMGTMNFSEIGYALNYKSSSHLASQFKMIVGVSMSEYRKSEHWNRRALDQII
ncbi:helix-turn-helix domain-containing protein [Aquimarina sp. 2-A2]|uniref:helix-turn-helix domain-containing protein n=1 Tax=Aquimarina sp. 2-A2 TaxID=3382644 RepID=UPI00387F0322